MFLKTFIFFIFEDIISPFDNESDERQQTK